MDSHLRHISTRGEGGGGLKIEDFSGDVIYGWPLLKHAITLVKVEIRQKNTIVQVIDRKHAKKEWLNENV